MSKKLLVAHGINLFDSITDDVYFLVHYHRDRLSRSPCFTHRKQYSDSEDSMILISSRRVARSDESPDRQSASREGPDIISTIPGGMENRVSEQVLEVANQTNTPLEISDPAKNQSQIDPEVTSLSGLPRSTESAREELSEEILQVMNQRIALVKIPAQEIHNELVVRIEEIIKNGLPMEKENNYFLSFLLREIVWPLSHRNSIWK